MYSRIECGFRDAVDLRKKISSHVKQHPNFNHWKESIFRNQCRLVNTFVHKHSKPGTFTDNYGILVYTAADLLNVEIRVVGTSNNQQDPYTLIACPRATRDIFWLGYHQDQTDNGGRAGHYVSLIPRLPLTPLPNPENLNLVTSEMKILDMLMSESHIVKMILERIQNIQVDFAVIKKSNIMETLKVLKLQYGSDTVVGACVRRLILKFNNILSLEKRSDVELVEDPEPEVDSANIVKNEHYCKNFQL